MALATRSGSTSEPNQDARCSSTAQRRRGRHRHLRVRVRRDRRAFPAPDDDVMLEADWALQDPTTTCAHLVRRSPRARGVGDRSADVVGIGIDFTACTMLPTLTDGTPLCIIPEYDASRTPG